MSASKTGAARSIDVKELVSGLLMVGLAAAFAWVILRPEGLVLGSARAMGPGYFPLMIAILLAGFGLIMIVNCVGSSSEEIAVVPFRSILMVLLGPVAFALLVRPLGFVIGVIAMVGIACWASYRMTLKWAVYTTAFMAVFCVVLFYYLLAMPVSLWGDGSILPFM